MLVRTLRRIKSSALGRRESPTLSAWQVIAWWEARRIPFNLVVGATGIVTSLVILATALVSEWLFSTPIGMPDPPIFAVIGAVVFAVGANVCYAGGWVAELIVKRAWPDESDRFGTLTFTLGLVFAVFVTLVPAGLISAMAVVYAIARWSGLASLE
jgi:hypothetical protein